MFAGQMRLRTFLLGVSALGLGGLGVVGWLGVGWWQSLPAAPPAPVVAPPVDERPAFLTQPATGGADVRPFDERLVSYLGKDLGTDKLKDIMPAGPKINVYQDAGQTSVNRAKVDLDRDEHDDEKWTFADGKIKRQVAPADDDRYTEEWIWSGSGWQRAGAQASAAPTGAAAASPAPSGPAAGGRPVDADVMTWRGKDLGTDKKKDVTSGKPYKVNVYQDAGSTTANRAKIDLDRDDKWDEKITFEPTRITREVAPADDEQYTETWHWDGAGWQRAK
jgi:hypothetical protein